MNSNSKANTNSNNTTRRERFHAHVVKSLAHHAAHGADIPAAWFEEIERRPMADVVTDWVCKQRGIGVKHPNATQAMHLADDEDMERGNVRARDNWEHEIATVAVMHHLANRTKLPIGSDLQKLIRAFYRKGDCGIDSAVVRAIKAAIA